MYLRNLLSSILAKSDKGLFTFMVPEGGENNKSCTTNLMVCHKKGFLKYKQVKFGTNNP